MNTWSQTLASRLRHFMAERNLNGNDLAIKAGVGRGTVNTFLRRVEKEGMEIDLTCEVVKKLAVALDVPIQQFFGVDPADMDATAFGDLARWAEETPAISKVLIHHGSEVSVGDLLRFRASPSSRGEYDAKEAWEHMKALRYGIDGGTDVTEAEESKVGPKRRRS